MDITIIQLSILFQIKFHVNCMKLHQDTNRVMLNFLILSLNQWQRPKIVAVNLQLVTMYSDDQVQNFINVT